MRALIASSLVLAAAALPAAARADATKLFTIQDPRITESSGIVASTQRDDVYFTHNDSGDSARFFAVDIHGCTIGTFTAPGVTATDWEDIARGPGQSIYLADTGDNNAKRAEVVIHRFGEPALGPATSGTGPCPDVPDTPVAPTSYRFTYEDGPHDAETLLVHPKTGQIFVVTKSIPGSEALYAAPEQPSTDQVNVLHKVADVIPPVLQPGDALFTPTAGDIAPDLKSVAIRDYSAIYIWPIPPSGDLAAAFAPGAKVERMTAPDAGMQGEGLAFTRKGDALVTSTEGANPPVYLVPRPVACKRPTSATLARPRGLHRLRATADGHAAKLTLSSTKVRVSLTAVTRKAGKVVVRLQGRTKRGGKVTVTRRIAICG